MIAACFACFPLSAEGSAEQCTLLHAGPSPAPSLGAPLDGPHPPQPEWPRPLAENQPSAVRTVDMAGTSSAVDSGEPGSSARVGGELAQGSTNGSGIARPLGGGWRPPPIPVPTLFGSGSSAKGEAASASAQSLGEDFSSG